MERTSQSQNHVSLTFGLRVRLAKLVYNVIARLLNLPIIWLFCVIELASMTFVTPAASWGPNLTCTGVRFSTRIDMKNIFIARINTPWYQSLKFPRSFYFQLDFHVFYYVQWG